MFASGCLKKKDVKVWSLARTLARNAFVFVIQLYRVLISPHFGRCCRFYPSCSVYAQQAIRERGVFKGLFLAASRLIKCQPFHPGGIDVLETRT